MAKAKIYYIRPNKTGELPVNLLFFDTETKPTKHELGELHEMYLAWSWRVTLSSSGETSRETWKSWTTTDGLCEYVQSQARPKAPLYLVGSNITVDLWASGLADELTREGWKAEMLYDKGLVTIIILERNGCRIKVLALQNFIEGGVAQWGELLGLPKQEVDFASDTIETISEYCKRDVEITGRTFLSYLDFLRSDDLGGFALTSSGQSFRAFRHRFMKERILHYDQRAFNQFVRAGYFGGRVECGYIGKPTDGPFTKLDINSMYPSIMRDCYFPTRLYQWLPNPKPDYTRSALQSYCGMAECRLLTNDPAYAVRHSGKLVFPVGEFTAFLSTGSLQYALKKGHVTKVNQLLLFHRAKLFTDFVDHFYGLRMKYKREGNDVWQAIVKKLLNSLYGKFGEKRERILHEEDGDPNEFYKRNVVIRTEGLIDEDASFDWRYHSEPWMDEEWTGGVEWEAFNKYQLSALEDEGPMSQPSIAAHVTDYGRQLLYTFMCTVGIDRVLYCDTDSLIIRERDVDRLNEVIDETELGKLKIEATEDHAVFANCKDYRFGGETKTKGIRSNAQAVAPDTFTQSRFLGLHSLLRAGIRRGFVVAPVTKELAGRYDKGTVNIDGSVSPLVFN